MGKENLKLFEKNSPAKYRELKENAQITGIEAARAIRRLRKKDQQERIEKKSHDVLNKATSLLEKHGSFEEFSATLTMGVGGKNYYKYLEMPIGDNSVAIETSLPQPTEEIFKKELDETEGIILLSIYTQDKTIPKIKFSIKSEGISIFNSTGDDKEKPTYEKANETELFELDKIIDALAAGAEYADKHLDKML